MIKDGVVALRHCIVSATALGGHAAADLAAFQQLPVGRGPVMAPLISVDQGLIRFEPAVPQGPNEGLQQQVGLHGGTKGSAQQTSPVKIGPHCQIPPACRSADVGDVTAQTAVGGCWAELLIQRVLRDGREGELRYEKA